MLFLPSWTWNVDPVFLHIPRAGVAATIAGLGVLMAAYGVARKEREQLITGGLFALAGLLIYSYMGPVVELRYYSLLFVVVFLGGHALPDFEGIIGTILHPSPASPKANRGWASIAERELQELGAL